MFKQSSIYFMSFAYIYVGIKHFIEPEWFVSIVPDYLPYHYSLVYISGFFEVLFGLLLLFKKYRKIACWGLILLLIAVFPANIFLAQNLEAQAAMNITQEFAWYRLPFQFLFIITAYWHSK